MYSLTLTDAWSAFRYFLQCMSALVEEPARLAARVWVQAQARDDILAWLAPLERMARLLLLAEAATLTLSPTQPRKPMPRREFKGSHLRPVPEESEDWRVAFKTSARSPRRRRVRSRRAAKRAFAPTVYDSVVLAARIEALIRVALNPAPYAKRLARKLDKRPLSRKQSRALFRLARPDRPEPSGRHPRRSAPIPRPFDYALPAFVALAGPARLRFESG